jgi:hypothetical protein
MPIPLENKLKSEAADRGVKDVGAYVYGTLRHLGWKPKREGGDEKIHPQSLKGK